MPRQPRALRLLALVACLVLFTAACGDDDDDVVADEPPVVPEDADTDELDGPDGDEPGTDDTTAGDDTVPDGTAEDPPAEAGSPDEGGDPLVFVADLTGDTEVPGPGDPVASGRTEIESSANGDLCFDMVAEGLDSDVTDAHIHEGAAGVSGGVVIPIGGPTSSEGDTDTWTDVCIAVDAEIIDRMLADPSGFYANIHTESFGAGAIRGQLEQATIFDLTLS